MFRKPMIWMVVGALAVAGLWLAVRPRQATPHFPAASAASAGTVAASATLAGASVPAVPLLSATNPAAVPPAALAAEFARYRVRNTAESLTTLARSPSALLLENATLDTARPLPELPAHLRAPADTASWMVQARGVMDDAFRARLREAGVTMVSYLPPNAWLVRGSAARVAWLQTQPEVRAALPFEPFYKLKAGLLPLAVEQTPLPAGTYLNIVVFADARNATREAILHTGANILEEAGSPFGPVLLVSPAPDSLPALARLDGVQLIERASVRVSATDLMRVTLGVSANSLAPTNFLGLTGTNVTVNVSDSGVDANHPDLVGRVTGDTPLALVDTDGHGTHVAGILAGSGASSATVPAPPQGSVPGANFRGIAPGASIFSLNLGAARVATPGTDAYAQETIARTNIFISNNSWGIGGSYSYDIFAASYDAAVRDALPGVPGSQPVLFVFAAGNEGGGDELGLGGFAGTIRSPANGKNVIAVGAIEQQRGITNEAYILPSTNKTAVWLGGTDSDYQVASYSGRGNVGVGIEGDYGRFKPDVVAPGSFVVAARSTDWDEVAYYSITNTSAQNFPNLTLDPRATNQYSVFVPANAIGLRIIATHQPRGTNPVLELPIFVREGARPTAADFLGFNSVSLPPDAPLNAPASYFYAVANPTNVAIPFSLRVEITVTNNLEDYNRELKVLNDALGPNYRFETGTSMAAPGIAGLLALMQEYFEQRFSQTNSPALMKALVINGARNLAPIYDLQTRATVNHQGWGLPRLDTILPPTNSPGPARALVMFDQNPTNALATGQSHTRLVTLADGADTRPLRITLVWTDPPGNPAAGLKLVNDLDLVVTNLDSGEVYFGNDITFGSFNAPWDTNALPVLDSVNNVENVFIAPPLATNGYSVTVIGRAVNVNAVTANTNAIVQDYALVISSGNREIPGALTVTEQPVVTADTRQFTVITNTGVPVPLLNQRVGASASTLVTLDGATNQWRFYSISNAAGYTNAVFLTFQPPNLAVPRMGVRARLEAEYARPEADIDLYVSLNPALTNLDPAALAAADKSLSRGGTEIITYSNAVPAVYYIAVKSEDQMAGEFGLFAGFSELPFDETDAFGNRYLRGFPAPVLIPDGSPANPGAGLMFAIATAPITVRKVIVTNVVTHENFGDLLGNLSHNNAFAVLNNHTYGDGAFTQERRYDDSGEFPLPGVGPTDGPGSLRNFVGQEGVGLWLLTMVDDAPGQVGQVDSLTIKLEPNLLDEGDDLLLNVGPESWAYATVNVPPGATNLTVCLTNLSSSPLPVDLYIRRGDFPTFDEFDKKLTVIPPAGCLTLTPADLPPLQAGRYYLGVYNPNSIEQQVLLSVTITGEEPVPVVFSRFGPEPLLDDAVTNSVLTVTNDQKVITVEAAIRLDHPRVSDLALQLVSPNGERVLLFENRGGLEPAGLGADLVNTNAFNFATNGGPAAVTNVFDTGATQGSVRFTYDFFEVPDTLTIYYDGVPLVPTTELVGSNSFTLTYGPGASTELVVVINQEGNTNATTQWQYSLETVSAGYLYARFTERTNLTTTPIKFGRPPFRPATNSVVVWTGGFEGGTSNAVPVAGEYFAEGWFVSDGSVDWLQTGTFGLTPDSGQFCIDLNGFGTNAPGTLVTNLATIPGRQYVLNFAWSRNPDGIPSGVPPTAEVRIGNVTAVITADLTNTWTALDWQRRSVPFLATGANTLLELRSTTTGDYGVLFDSFELVETVESSGIYLPEEPLTAFQGTDARGDWKLEIWDTRVGATNPAPELLAWNLGFIFEVEPVSAISLEHGVPVTVNVPPGGFQYFIVDVPAWAQFATNTLLSATAPVTIWFNQNGAPQGVNPPDTELIPATTGPASVTLAADGSLPPPLLRPGQRYYLRAQNNNPTPATLTYRVDYDLTGLTNGVPFCATQPAGGIPRYFSYTVSTNATAVAFELSGLTGNLNLLARRAALPQPFLYDYAGLNPGLLDEEILILTNSLPVPLAPGTWYLAVVNTTIAPANYCLTATEFTNALPVIITLTNGVPFNATNARPPGTADYYRYPVTAAAARLQLETFAADGDVTLVASRGLPLPDLFTFDYRSARPGTNDELIVILTNSAPVTLTPGDWFLAVVKMQPGPVRYTVMATEWPATGRPLTILSSGPTGTNTWCITWASLPGVHYFVEGKTNFLDPAWTVMSPVITAVDTTTTWCFPWPSPFTFFRVVEGKPVTDAGLDTPVAFTSITRGPGGVTLQWFGPVDAQFEVQWTDTLNPPNWTAFVSGNPVTSPSGLFSFTDDGTETGGFGVTRFYRLVRLP
ncbi:MAG: S8 family serine peptidase [Limisphaerales bacterium]